MWATRIKDRGGQVNREIRDVEVWVNFRQPLIRQRNAGTVCVIRLRVVRRVPGKGSGV